MEWVDGRLLRQILNEQQKPPRAGREVHLSHSRGAAIRPRSRRHPS
jgi:hypothetical protein